MRNSDQSLVEPEISLRGGGGGKKDFGRVQLPPSRGPNGALAMEVSFSVGPRAYWKVRRFF